MLGIGGDGDMGVCVCLSTWQLSEALSLIEGPLGQSEVMRMLCWALWRVGGTGERSGTGGDETLLRDGASVAPQPGEWQLRGSHR